MPKEDPGLPKLAVVAKVWAVEAAWFLTAPPDVAPDLGAEAGLVVEVVVVDEVDFFMMPMNKQEGLYVSRFVRIVHRNQGGAQLCVHSELKTSVMLKEKKEERLGLILYSSMQRCKQKGVLPK